MVESAETHVSAASRSQRRVERLEEQDLLDVLRFPNREAVGVVGDGVLLRGDRRRAIVK